MPTPEEIKKIAREYAESDIPNGIDEEYSRSIIYNDGEMFGRFLEWLSKDYCIVPKEVIRKEYEKAKSAYDIYTSATCINEMERRMIDHAEGRMCELTTLFGLSLFNEEKE